MKCEKMDKFDYLIALATLDARDDDIEMYEELDNSDVELSERITNNIEKLIRKESRTERLNRIRKTLSKVAVIALVVISVIFTAMMSVSAIRTAIWEIITEWYEEYIAIGYEPKDEYGVVEPPKMIEEIRKPTLVPLGMEEEIGMSGRGMFACNYYLGDDCYISFKQLLLNNDVGALDGDDATISEVVVGKHKAWLFSYDAEDYIILIWNDTEYAYHLSTTMLNADELILVATSVK